MRRPRSWVATLLIWFGILVGAMFVGLAASIPGWISRRLVHVSGGRVSADRVRLQFPCTLILEGVEVTSGPDAQLASERIVLVPRSLRWSKRLVQIGTLEFIRLRASYHRTGEGTVLYPNLSVFSRELLNDFLRVPAPLAGASMGRPWQVTIDTLRLVDGTIEYVDQQAPQPFRGALTDVSVVGGPLAVPLRDEPISLAAHATFTGHADHAAALYCSGWVNPPAQALSLSCQMDPLRLAAFDPYYKNTWQGRVDHVTLKVSSTLAATNNALKGRAQVEIGNLSEADLAMLGDVEPTMNPILSGELQVEGPLDQPAQWAWQLVPGNDIVQLLLKPLFKRDIRIRVGDQTIPVGLTPADELTMSAIEAGKKQVEDDLQIIAPISVEPSEPVASIESAPLPISTPTPLPPSPSPSPIPPPTASEAPPVPAETIPEEPAAPSPTPSPDVTPTP